MSYTKASFGLNTKNFEQTRKIIGAVPVAFSTRLQRKDAYASKTTRILTGTLIAENIARILIPAKTSVADGIKTVENVMNHLANYEFAHSVVSELWPSSTQRLDIRDQMIQPHQIAAAVRASGVDEDHIVYAMTDVLCSMLSRTGMVAHAKPTAGISVNGDERVELDDLQREAIMQAVEAAFNDVAVPLNFDSDKIRPDIIAQYIAEKSENIYSNLRGVSAQVKMVDDAVAIMRMSMEEFATNGQLLDESIRTSPALNALMKDITLHRIARTHKNNTPGCEVTFYNTRLNQLENMLTKSKRLEFVTPKRSISHITVDRIDNAKGVVTDVVIMAHAKPANDTVVVHHLARDTAQRLHSLMTEVEETQTLGHYVEKVVNGSMTDRTRRTVVSLLSANAIHREDTQDVDVHIMGGVTEDDMVALAVMNSTNLYMTGIKDLQAFAPEILYHKVLNVDGPQQSLCAQPAGRVITTGNAVVMAAYSAEQELVEAKDYTREGFASEIASSNILGNLSDYAHRDLSRTRKYAINSMGGKTYSTTLNFYTLLTTRVPHNHALLKSNYAEAYLDMHINIVKAVYTHVVKNFSSTGEATINMHTAHYLFGYFEEVMKDTGTYNLVRSVGYDLVSDIQDRSERATFFHELFEGDYYGQTAFAVITFILTRAHRIDANTYEWLKEMFNKTTFWTHNSQSIISAARGNIK